MPARKAFISQLREEAGPTDFYVDKGIVLPMPTLKKIREAEAKPAERIRILMGDDFDRVVEYWDDHPISYWQKFTTSYLDFVYGRGADDEGKSMN